MPEPYVVRSPAVSIRSFTPTGMPCSGPRWRPATISRSASRASARTASGGTRVVNAFRLGSMAAIRSRIASARSTGEIARRPSSSAASVSVRRVSRESDTRAYSAHLVPASNMGERGFVLTPTYRIVAGRPQVHLYAVLENGEPALIVDTRVRPYCFVRASDVERARPVLGATRFAETPLANFAGDPVVRVEFNAPADLPIVRGRLAERGVPTFEGDVRFAYRYLIDHGIRGAFHVDGPFERRPGVG